MTNKKLTRREILDSGDRPYRLEGVVFLEGDDPAVRSAAGAVRNDLRRVIAECIRGRRPEFGSLALFAVTAETPADDQRRKFLSEGLPLAHHLAASGQASLASNLDRVGPFDPAAIQVVVTPNDAEVRFDAAIEGRAYVVVAPGKKKPLYVEFGFEFRTRRTRSDCTHITIFYGMVDGEPAALVSWNVAPSIIRKDPAEQMWRKMERSIPPAARGRWGRVREGLRDTPDDLKTALFEITERAPKAGTVGSAMLDYLDPERRRGSQELSHPHDEKVIAESQDSSDDFDSHAMVDARDAVSRVLGDLAPDERQVLDLKAENLTQTQIAARLGKSQPTVSRLMQSATRKIAQSLHND